MRDEYASLCLLILSSRVSGALGYYYSFNSQVQGAIVLKIGMLSARYGRALMTPISWEMVGIENEMLVFVWMGLEIHV